ncbi:MAG: hypothetical protein ACKOYG_05945 [Ilumatobacteraceae bacterium]
MHIAARVRWTLARHPSLYWLAIGLCAFAAATSVHRAGREAATARDRWGAVVDVVVADTGIERGQSLDASVQPMPLAMVPDGALTELPAAGTVAARGIAARAIVTALDLAASATPDGWLTISLAAVAPPVVAGDQVAVLASGVLLCDGIVSGTPDDELVDVAVPASCAVRASGAVASGDLMLGRRG